MIKLLESKKWLFSLSLLLGTLLVVGFFGYFKLTHVPLDIHHLSGNLFISKQLLPNQLAEAKRQGFKTIIDFRPDGEAPDQPTSAQMQATSLKNNLQFAYIPIAHGEIPDEAVKKLNEVLKNSPQPVLMYCRSGKRAARTWSLVEASNPTGATETEILQAVTKAGQTADDLQPKIHERIENRKSISEETK